MDQDILRNCRDRFDTFGLLRVRNVFSRDEQDRILDDIATVTGLGDDAYPDVAAGRSKAYCSPGTITRNKVFWPIIYHENILTLMRVLIDENVNFMGDNLSVHWHNVGFHRDQEFDLANPPAWDPNYEQYRFGRVLAYLNHEGAPPNHLLFRPFSDKSMPELPALNGMMLEDLTSWSVPLTLEPGDCVVFDPRVVHSGAPLEGPKNMISLSYGTENLHTIDAYFYGRFVRTEEGYTDWPDELVDELRARNLFPESMIDPDLWAKYEKKYEGVHGGDPEELDRLYRRDMNAAERAKLGARTPSSFV